MLNWGLFKAKDDEKRKSTEKQPLHEDILWKLQFCTGVNLPKWKIFNSTVQIPES